MEILLGMMKLEVFFKDSSEEAARFLVETGKAISVLAAKAKLRGYMGNSRSWVKVGVRDVPAPRLRVTHGGPWLPEVAPIAVPAARVVTNPPT